MVTTLSEKSGKPGNVEMCPMSGMFHGKGVSSRKSVHYYPVTV